MTTFQKCIIVLITLGIGAYFYQGVAARKATEQEYQRFMGGCITERFEINPDSGRGEGRPGSSTRRHACELLWIQGN